MKYLALLLIGFLPAASFAATYHYVTEANITNSVEASDAQTALSIAPNIAPTSGVALDQGYIEPGMDLDDLDNTNVQAETELQAYVYLSVDGTYKTVFAHNAQQALTLAPDIAPNSGVLVVE